MDAGSIAYAAGAIIMAIERGLRAAPDFRKRLPRLVASENWELAPLLLLLIAGIIWFGRFWEGTNIIQLPTSVAPATMRVFKITDGRKWLQLNASQKWNLQVALRELGGAAKIVIVRYTNPDCEDLGQNLYDVFQSAGWEQPDAPGAPFEGNLPKGITLYSRRGDNRAHQLRDALSEHLGIPIHQIDADGLKNTDPIQLTIGNVPEHE